MKSVLAAMTAACLFVSGAACAEAKNLSDLPWQHGPTTGRLGAHATVRVPDGYAFLDPAGAQEFDRLTENPTPDGDEYVLAKDDLSWVAFFQFDDVGYVKDNDTLDADELLESVKEGTEADNAERRRNGWEPVSVSGWAFKPQYDAGIKSLEWAFRLHGEQSNVDSINYNTRLLGRHGVMRVLVLTSPEHLQASVADFKARLPGFSFNPGETYAEYRAGDHVAEYGLAALVTGGAVAVAAKKGLFGAIAAFLAASWKLVLAGLAAVGAGVRRLFGKARA